MRFGANFWGPYPLRQWVEYVALAERVGFDIGWIGETQLVTPDVYATVALCANATSSIQIGPGVTNTVTRDPTVTAGAVLALEEFAPGRCLLGLGVGGSAVGSIGLGGERPAEFRRKLLLIRQLLGGETVQVNGVEVRPKIVSRRVPIYVASSSPSILEIAGELADGVIMNVGVTPELVREALGHVERGAHRSSRPLAALDVTVVAGCSVGDDRSRTLADCRPWAAMTARRLARWMVTAGEELRGTGAAVLRQYRWQEHLAAGADHARDVGDEVTRQLALAGTPEDCVETIVRLEACGVTQVAPFFMGTDVARSVEAFGRGVIPRWSA